MQADELILSGRADDWTPSYSWHGFRYVEVTVPHDPANRSKCAPGWKHGAVVQVEDEHVPNRVFYAKIPSGNLTSLKPGRTFHYVVRPPVLFAK